MRLDVLTDNTRARHTQIYGPQRGFVAVGTQAGRN